MNLYSIRATRASDETIEHHRLSMTKALPILRHFVRDGWTATIWQNGEARHQPPPAKRAPANHPWKVNAAVPSFMRSRR